MEGEYGARYVTAVELLTWAGDPRVTAWRLVESKGMATRRDEPHVEVKRQLSGYLANPLMR